VAGSAGAYAKGHQRPCRRKFRSGAGIGEGCGSVLPGRRSEDRGRTREMIASRLLVRKSGWLIAVLMAVMVAAPTWAQAATPRDELLGLVPEDAAFCLVIQDLRSHALDLVNSPFFRELKKSPLGHCLHEDPDAEQLQAALQEVLGVLQTTWPEV